MTTTAPSPETRISESDWSGTSEPPQSRRLQASAALAVLGIFSATGSQAVPISNPLLLPVTASAESYGLASVQGYVLQERYGPSTLLFSLKQEPSADITDPAAKINWLHEESGLTWDQLSRALGVSRRSVHLWASGRKLSASNLERLTQVYGVVRELPWSTSSDRLRELFRYREGMPSLYDELVAGATHGDRTEAVTSVGALLGVATEGERGGERNRWPRGRQT